jgi:hypothetical protein
LTVVLRYFNQPRKDALVQGPKKKYPLVTGGEFTTNAMKLYYAGLKAKLEGKDEEPAAEVAPTQSSTIAVAA